MSARDRVHRLIDELPESELAAKPRHNIVYSGMVALQAGAHRSRPYGPSRSTCRTTDSLSDDREYS
jgi:hypothetical protein